MGLTGWPARRRQPPCPRVARSARRRARCARGGPREGASAPPTGML